MLLSTEKRREIRKEEDKKNCNIRTSVALSTTLSFILARSVLSTGMTNFPRFFSRFALYPSKAKEKEAAKKFLGQLFLVRNFLM